MRLGAEPQDVETKKTAAIRRARAMREMLARAIRIVYVAVALREAARLLLEDARGGPMDFFGEVGTADIPHVARTVHEHRVSSAQFFERGEGHAEISQSCESRC